MLDGGTLISTVPYGVGVECPRCGDCVTTFRLGDSEAVVCESCEYTGIPADHRPEERGPAESWEDVLERYRADASADTADTDAGGAAED